MKKNEKYTVVNNQEDEDGYFLYPDYNIYGESFNEKQKVSAVHKAAKTGRNSSKPGLENFTISTSVKPGRDKN